MSSTVKIPDKPINFINYKRYFLIETQYRQFLSAKRQRAREAMPPGPVSPRVPQLRHHAGQTGTGSFASSLSSVTGYSRTRTPVAL